MSETIVCPSGLTGEIRGLKGKEAALLSDRSAVRSGMFMDRLLASCWLGTVDPGPYQPKPDGSLDWQQVLLGDRFYALLHVRVATLGPDYVFKAQCPSTMCRARFDWQVHLLNDLPVRRLSPEDLEAFRAGNRLEGVLPDSCGEVAGRRFWFRLSTGADEARYARQRGQQAAVTAMLAQRVVEIEGVPDTGRRKFLDEAEFRVLTTMLAEMDQRDCGVETTFEVECPECYLQATVDLPFERGFLFPTAGTRK